MIERLECPHCHVEFVPVFHGRELRCPGCGEVLIWSGDPGATPATLQVLAEWHGQAEEE